MTPEQRTYRAVTIHHDLAIGDRIKTSYAPGGAPPYEVTKIVVDDLGRAFLTCVVPREYKVPGYDHGEYYLNGYRKDPDGTWRTGRSDTLTILSKAPAVQSGLFEATP